MIDSERSGATTGAHIVAIIAVALSAAAIAAAARGDLWLDEIWSINFARSSVTPLDIFRIHHDNNHVLNTLYLYVVRNAHLPMIDRMFSIVCGVASVAIAGVAASRWRSRAGVLAVVLTGSSYPLIVYFSEARGYAAAIFCAFAALAIIQRDHKRPLAGALLFWIVCALGALAHLTFVLFLASAFVAALPRGWRHATIYCGPPLIFAGLWVAYFSSDLVFGRGPVYGTSFVLSQASSFLLGTPFGLALYAVVAATAIVAAGTLVIRRGEDLWLIFPCVCIVAPAAFLLLAHPRYLYFRYLLIPMAMFQLPLAACIDAIAERSLVVASLIVAILIGAQSIRVGRLITLGRGHYRAALTDIAEHTDQSVIRVSSDDDVANGTVLRFYASALPPQKTLRYIPIAEVSNEPPEWFLYHTQDVDEEPAPGLILAGRIPYRFIARYPFAGVSGWQWFVFRIER